MRFVYVLPGLEGFASDSRILRNVLTRSSPLVIPSGKYYLVDAGYTNGPGFLVPYRSTRYHLNEWATCGNRLTNYKELFNLRHSLARRDCAFVWVVKETMGDITVGSFFNVKTQVGLIMEAPSNTEA